jgi:hypothetical protein
MAMAEVNLSQLSLCIRDQDICEWKEHEYQWDAELKAFVREN